MDFCRKLYSGRYSPPALGEEGRFHFILQGENEDPVPVHAIFFRERTDLDMEKYGRGLQVPEGMGKGVVEEFVKFLYLEELGEDVGLKEECNLLRLSILTELKREYQHKLVTLIDVVKNKRKIKKVRKDPEEDPRGTPSAFQSPENVDDSRHHHHPPEGDDDVNVEEIDQQHEERRPRGTPRETMPKKNGSQGNVRRMTTRSISRPPQPQPRGQRPVIVVIPLPPPIAPSTISTRHRHPGIGNNCYFCSKKFSSLKFLEVHFRDHTKETPIRPQKQPARNRTHKETPCHPKKQPARNRNRMKCSKCQKTFANKGSLAHHLRHTHRQFAIHTCPHCPRKFKGRRYLQQHLDAVHKGRVKNSKCIQCQKTFRNKHSLKIHVDAIHKKIKHHCPHPHCNGVYSHLTNLTTHLKEKHGKK